MKIPHLIPPALASIVSLSNAASPRGMPVIIAAIQILGDASNVNADQTSDNIKQKENAPFRASNNGNILSFLKGKVLNGVKSRGRHLPRFHIGIRGGGYNTNDRTNEATIVATKSAPRKLAGCSEDYVNGSSYNLGNWVSAAATITSDPVYTLDPNTGLWITETTTMTKKFNYKCTSSSRCGSMGYGPGETGESAAWEKEAAECSDTAIPAIAPTPPLWSEIGCPRVYAAGTDYDGGDVISVNGIVYRCAAEPSNLWCGMTGYEPGNSQHWKSAWEINGSCSGSLEPTRSPSFEVLSNEGGCPAEYEYGGVQYEAGDTVSNGSFIFRCKSWPQSLHCSQSGFEPGVDSVTEYWKQAWVLVARCSGTIKPTSSPNFNSLRYLGRCPQEYITSGNYEAGDLVAITASSNPSRMTIYECKAFPFEGYCIQGAYYPAGPYGYMGWNLKGYCDTPEPTSQPSMNPSASGSYQPSAQPSMYPSASSMPSRQPSEHPSVSDWPTSQPSEYPSLTGRPSSMPSSQPSFQPSSGPSVQPSSGPSAQPSSQPSSMPSEAPSVTDWPSSLPSESPSISAAPSSQPSEKPSVSDWPTSQPSSQPSAQPSMYPSASSMPSGQPSEHPSVSDWPTSQPSESPSLTGRPSSMPSSQPSFQPSSGPSVQPSSHPSVFVSSSDIGNVGVPGSASRFSDGRWVVKGSGNDIWGLSDQFHYVHFAKTGNVVLELLVDSFDNIHSWQKGGLMFRESLDVSSKHYSLYVTGSNGIANQWRDETDGATDSLQNSALKAKPVWIQVSKAANEFSTAYKYEGDSEYTPLWGPTTIAFSSDFYVGIAVLSHENNRLATLKAREFNIDMPTPEPTLAPTQVD